LHLQDSAAVGVASGVIRLVPKDKFSKIFQFVPDGIDLTVTISEQTKLLKVGTQLIR
jgi:hypothetical protein